MKKKLKKYLILFYQEIMGLPLIAKCVVSKLFAPNNTILLKGFFIFEKCRIANFNWGDDINYYFLKMMTGKRILLLPDTYIAKNLPFQNYLCIGSTIMSFDMRNTIVWGTGLLNDKKGFRVKSKPKEIRAVRGPLTRQWLLEQGVECPAVYGDPALLLPLYYMPHRNKKYKLGIIPHYTDLTDETVKSISVLDGVKLIKISGYKNWLDFIDQINECDFIVSSSLHGIIVSEAYNVPSLWVKFKSSNYIDGWDYKFHDFYCSLGKDIEPYWVSKTTTYDDLLAKVSNWTKGEIDVKKLLDVCPFI